MTGSAHYRALESEFDQLLDGLAARWPAEDIAYLREEVGHGEYGDALENLVAIGIRGERGLSLEEVAAIEQMARAMQIEHSPLLARLFAARTVA